MEVTAVKLRNGQFARAGTPFEIEIEVAKKRRLSDHLDQFRFKGTEMDGKARVLIIGYVSVSPHAYEPTYYEFMNDERVFAIGGLGVYFITVETPVSFPSTISEKEFEVKYVARVSLKPWEANDFVEREFTLLRPITKFDISLYHRANPELEGGGKKVTKDGAIGVSAKIAQQHPYAAGETVNISYDIQGKKAVKKCIAKLLREVKLKLPNNAADESFEFVKVLEEQKVPIRKEGHNSIAFALKSDLPSLEGCPTSVHWNLMHVHYFVQLIVDAKDGKKVEVKLPLLYQGGIETNLEGDEEENLPVEILSTTQSPSLKPIAKIEHVDGRYVTIVLKESAVFPLLRIICRGEAIVRKPPSTIDCTYPFIDHRTDIFYFNLSKGQNQLPIGFGQEATDTFVSQHKMMPMSFESPWVSIVYTCRVYGLKNSDFIEAIFKWGPDQCPGFEEVTEEFGRAPEIPIKRKEVVNISSVQYTACEVRLRSGKAVVGEPIMIDAVIEQNVSKEWSQIVTQLIQNVRYRVPQRKNMVYHDNSRIVAQCESEYEPRNEIKFELPDSIPPTVRCDWDVLDISYALLLKAIPKESKKSLFQVTVPIMVGYHQTLRNTSGSLGEIQDPSPPVADNEYETKNYDRQSLDDALLSRRSPDIDSSEMQTHNYEEELIERSRRPTVASQRLPHPSPRLQKSSSHRLIPEKNIGEVPTPHQYRKKHHRSKSPKKSPRVSPRPPLWVADPPIPEIWTRTPHPPSSPSSPSSTPPVTPIPWQTQHHPSAQPHKMNGTDNQPQRNYRKPSTCEIYGEPASRPKNPLKPGNGEPVPGWVNRLYPKRTVSNFLKPKVNRTGKPNYG